MNFVIFIPTFLIFLYVFYRIVKDDHVFLRKNIKLEQIFDVVFIATVTGVIFAQVIHEQNSLSLPQGIIGAALCLLLISKYKKFPLGRIFDFFVLSLITALPAGFLIAALFYRKTSLILYLVEGVYCILLAIFFTKNFLPKIMNRTFKEGNLSIYILLLFSLFSLLISIFTSINTHHKFLNNENIVLLILFFSNAILLVRQNFLKKR